MRYINRIGSGLLALAVLASAGAARADSQYFNIWMTGSGQKAQSFDFSDGDLDLHVTGGAYDYGNDWQDAKYLGKWSMGIGVQNSTRDGSHTVDGYGWKDVLWLDFSEEVWLTKIFFGWTWGKQHVELLDENADSLGTYELTQTGYNGLQYLDLSGENIGGGMFGLKAPGSHDSWKVKGIKGHTVPVPTAGLAGLALMGVLAMRRRRKA